LSGYCDVAPGHPVHAHYHDREYGFPLEDEAGLFERLVLEINQAGLSWELMLKKRDNFRALPMPASTSTGSLPSRTRTGGACWPTRASCATG